MENFNGITTIEELINKKAEMVNSVLIPELVEGLKEKGINKDPETLLEAIKAGIKNAVSSIIGTTDEKLINTCLDILVEERSNV